MFEEGSPKESHRVIAAAGVIAGVLMIIASFYANVVFRAYGREVELNDGAGWLAMSGVLVVLLLIAWHRGWIADSWPLAVSIVAAAFALVFLISDLHRGWEWSATTEVAVSPMLYVGIAASVTAIVACTVGLLRPVRERSEARGQWSREQWESQRTRETERTRRQ